MTYEQCKEQAKANADRNGEVWCVFSSTSGQWRNERYRGQPSPSWSGVQFELVTPEDLKARFIVRHGVLDENTWMILDMLKVFETKGCVAPRVVAKVYEEGNVQSIVSNLNHGYAAWKRSQSIGEIMTELNEFPA